MNDTELTAIDPDTLKSVSGGMKYDDFRRADIEDRRDMSPDESTYMPLPPITPTAPLVRTPGDLSSQLGLDDIDRR